MGVTLPFKHDTKRIYWLLNQKVYLLFSNFIAVATSEKERIRMYQLIRYTERYEPRETDNICSRLTLFVVDLADLVAVLCAWIF